MISLGLLRDQTRRTMPNLRHKSLREGAALEPSSKSAVNLSAVLPKPTTDWASESRDAQLHKKLYSPSFSLPLFLFLKPAQLICVSVGRSLTPTPLCVLIKQAFSESRIFSSLFQRGGDVCPAWTPTQISLQFATSSMWHKMPNWQWKVFLFSTIASSHLNADAEISQSFLGSQR